MENQEDLLQIIKSLKEEIDSLKKVKEKPKRKYKPRIKKTQILEEKPVDRPRGGIKFKGNLFKDDGTLCEEDKVFDKKVSKNRKNDRKSREAAKPIDRICSRCMNKFSVFQVPGSSTYYVCPKCAKA